jgi:hydrogenase expression/formation protein HypE
MNDKNSKPFALVCPVPTPEDPSVVKLSEGSGGRDMRRLIDDIGVHFKNRGEWKHSMDDGATLAFGDKHLVFTTDSYVVTPIFFPGGNIGKVAYCGTINDLAVMGAKPLGLSLAIVLEEGFSKKELHEILGTIGALAEEHGIPVVTGDTKVMERGAVDKIVINTSGIGVVDVPLEAKVEPGDAIIVSGGIGEHGTALLAKRFELETDIVSDSKPLHKEIDAVRTLVKQARDITRGGMASVLNELAEKNGVRFLIQEEDVPMQEQVQALTDILGVEIYNLACEGRFVCFASSEKSDAVVTALKKFNPMAAKVGVVEAGKGVTVQTRYGKKLLTTPIGEVVPRIC